MKTLKTLRKPSNRVGYQSILFALALIAVWAVPAAAQSVIERTNRGVVAYMTGPSIPSVTMAMDLARVVDDGSTRRVLPVIGRGADQGLNDLLYLRGIDVGVARLDVLEAAKRGGLVSPKSLTYITRLNVEKLHVLAPVTVNGIGELAGKRVAFARSALPAGPALFDLMGIKVDAEVDDAAAVLQKLRKRQVAAAVFLGSEPIPALAALGVSENLRLLPVSPVTTLPAIYESSRLPEEAYPSLMPARSTIVTVGVGTALLVAPLAPSSDRYRNVANVVEAFFPLVPQLQDKPGTSAWNEVDLTAEVPGWQRFPPAAAWLARNAAPVAALPTDDALRALFSRFLDERSLLVSGGTMSEAEKEQIFNLFQGWLKSQSQSGDRSTTMR